MPANQLSHIPMKSIARFDAKRLQSLFFAVITCAAVIQTTHAQSTWTGAGADQNWSTAGNWSGIVPNNDAVTFPDGGFPVTTNVQGAVNNIVQSSTTISSLTFNNLNNDFDTTQIPSSTKLTINGNLTVGTSDGTANHTTVAMTGGGALVGGTGSSTFSGQSGNGNSGPSSLSLSGLSSFVFNAGGGSSGAFNLGTGSSGASFTLALAAVSNNITAGTMVVGNNNTRGTVILNLGGGTNIINADTLNVGFTKTSGTLQFTNPGSGLKVASHTGTGRATLNISGMSNTGGTTANNNGSVLLNGGTVNILAGTITVGDREGRGGGGTANGVLAFNNGIVDASALNLSINTNGGGPARGTVAVGGGTLKVGNSVSLVNETGDPGTGTLIVTNGAVVIISNNVFKTTANGVGTLSVADSSLTVGGTIGISNNLPVDNFNLTNATLTVPVIGVGSPDITVVNFNPDVTTGTNFINISSLPAITSFPTQLPVLTYSTPGGNLGSLVLGTLPNTFSGYISNNTTSSSIDLVLTSGPAAKADTWTGAASTLWDTASLNWTSSGLPTNYVDLDEVTFDDSALTNSVTVTGTRIPATVNGLRFNNNSLKYVLTGTGKLSGPAQLVMNGSASVTLSQTGGDNFSGGIAANAGTLILDDANSSISGGLTIAGPATVQIGNNDGNGGLPSGTLDNEGTLIFNRANGITVGSVISGGGSLLQNGSGTLTLSASNTYSGNTTVGNGTLALTGAGSITSSPTVVVTNATLDVSGISTTTTLNALDLTNSALSVKVGYLQTNLTVSSLNMGGTSNAINVRSLPPIAFYPSTNVLLQSGSPVSGYNFVLGSLPAGSPAYLGTTSLSADGTRVLLTLTAGPIGARPSVTWSGSDAIGGVNTNWSDALNWQAPGVPVPAELVSFNNSATANASPFDVIGDGPGGVVNPGNINNIVDVSLTNATLTYANTGGRFHNTRIGSGRTLTVNGSVAVSGSSGNVSILGSGGTLKINNPANSTTLNVQNGTAPMLDMSGLDNFIGTINQIGVGYNTANSGSIVSGKWYLARTNSITTGGGFSGTGAALIVGGGGNGSGQLFLGQSNALFVDGITMGISTSGSDLIMFNPAFNNNPVAYVRGILGGASRVTLWSLGDSTVNLNNTTPNGLLTNDFSAGTLNALVDTLAVGQGSQGNTAPAVPFKGLFNMGAGILDVTTLKVGSAGTGNSAGAGVGIMNVSGGTVVANSLFLPASSFVSGGGVSGTVGTLNLTNATLIVSNSISVATNSGGGTLNVVSSTVKVLNGEIGSLSAPLTTLGIDGALLQLNVDGNAASAIITATTVNANNPSTINIGAIVNVNSPVQLPLLSYTGTDPFGALILGGSPVGYSVALVDNPGNSSIDLSITPFPRITSIGVNGITLSLTAINGTADSQVTLLGSTNLAVPTSQWIPLLTNNFDGSGNLNLSTNIVNPAVHQEFYILRMP
jgi:autotransporter-associated beta strand protein